MSFCPSCKYEYVPGVTKCPDCRVDLVEDLSQAVAPVELNVEDGVEQPEWADLVQVASYPFEIAAQEAKIRLNGYGIISMLSNEFINQTNPAIALATGGVHVLVDRQDAEAAVEILGKDDEELVEEAFLASEAEGIEP